ncbi:hypothetical protein [Streptomyces decoyicus]|uniref:hypothetical protein n=1 Tax=Streptomyces decoyicus TaxID=249567 RepID=UPI0036687AE3
MAHRADQRRRRTLLPHRRPRRIGAGRQGLIRRVGRRIRAVRLPRLRTLLLWVIGLLTTVMVTGPAAAAAVHGPARYTPGGVGDLMPSPLKPHGQGTLFETYKPNVYQLDKQLSDVPGVDLVDNTLHGIASVLLSFVTMVGRAAVTITQWTFNVISLPEVEPAISKAIGAAATPMAKMFLPMAVAVGMLIAWARRSDQSMLGQLAWVAASAALATTFFTSPATWVKGIDKARQAGSTVAMTTIDGGLAGDTSNALPFKTPTPEWSGKARDDALRKASDSVWRSYVATPWCIADLGSIEACKRWGPEVVKRGSDMEKREEYLDGNMVTGNAGEEAVQWRQGHNPSGRIGVLLGALISIVIFSVMVIILAGTMIASLLGALMLLVCGVVFAALWCIPGRPRQWGVSWLEALVGLTVVSCTATMLLGSVLIVNMALLSMLQVYGWLIVSMLNIATAAMALKLKGRLDGIVSAGGAQLAGRGTLNTLGHMMTSRRINNALSGARRGGGGGLVGTIRRGNWGAIRDSWGRGGGSQQSSSGGGAGGFDFRVTRARTYPQPPSYPMLTSGYGNHAATRPGLPGGPGGPRAIGRGPGGLGQGPRSGTPALGPAAYAAKSDAARQIAPAARSGYPVRPGMPERGGVPPHPRQNGPKTLQGKVVDPPNPTGAKFRSFPPPAPAQRTSGARPSAPPASRHTPVRGEVVRRRELPPTPRRPAP